MENGTHVHRLRPRTKASVAALTAALVLGLTTASTIASAAPPVRAECVHVVDSTACNQLYASYQEIFVSAVTGFDEDVRQWLLYEGPDLSDPDRPRFNGPLGARILQRVAPDHIHSTPSGTNTGHEAIERAATNLWLAVDWYVQPPPDADKTRIVWASVDVISGIYGGQFTYTARADKKHTQVTATYAIQVTLRRHQDGWKHIKFAELPSGYYY